MEIRELYFPHTGQRMKRDERSDRHLTTKGVKDGKCIKQTLTDVGTWPSGQPMQQIKYLHVTKGWRTRLLPPLLYKSLIPQQRKIS